MCETSFIILSTAKSWELSLCEFATGFAIGIHFPTQQLLVGECTSPKYRAGFAVLCYLLFLLGHLLSHALSHNYIVAVPGLCILNVVILSAHLVAVGFLHPESPRYLLSVRGKKFPRIFLPLSCYIWYILFDVLLANARLYQFATMLHVSLESYTFII